MKSEQEIREHIALFKNYLITANAAIFTPEHNVITGKIKALEWVLEDTDDK
jgi:hypothetical protein